MKRHEIAPFALSLMLAAVSCGSSIDDGDIVVIDTTADVTKGDTMRPHESLCVPSECGTQCGHLSDGCDSEIDCGPCADGRLEQLHGFVADYVQAVATQTYAQDLGFEVDRVSRSAREILQEYGASDAGYIAAIRHVMLESRIGHAGFYDTSNWTCTDIEGASDGSLSRMGACAVGHPDGMLITSAMSSNPLGLTRGDVVVAVDGLGGDALTDWSLRRPVCGEGAASPNARREEAARSFFSALPQGAELTVQHLNGSQTMIEVPATPASTHWMYCRDPLARPTENVVTAELRPDGVGVIRLTSFLPPGGFDPQRDVPAQIEAFKAAVDVQFESVRDANALIWDVRSNIGGFSLGGFEIAAGMVGARATGLARCTTRVPNTSPAEYAAVGPNYDLVPDARFGFAGPVAVLIDGRTASAGDYFALAASLGTDALLVGTPTAGAFGSSGALLALTDNLGLSASYDAARCNDLDGRPLEGRGVTPNITVEYDPADVAAGVDTVLERALEALLAR